MVDSFPELPGSDEMIKITFPLVSMLAVVNDINGAK